MKDKVVCTIDVRGVLVDMYVCVWRVVGGRYRACDGMRRRSEEEYPKQKKHENKKQDKELMSREGQEHTGFTSLRTLSHMGSCA